MMQAVPMPTSMTVQMTARGVGPSHMAASMATPGMPQSPTSVRQLPDQSVAPLRSEEHTSELQSLMRISYAVFCLQKKKKKQNKPNNTTIYKQPRSTIDS